MPYEGFPELSYTHRGSPPRRTETPPPRMYYVLSTLGPQEWLERHHVMVSAGTAWRNPGDGFSIATPDNPASLFIDSGGYQAAVHFRDAYPYSPRRLFEWAESVGADYVAGMDWACEEGEELTSAPQVTVDPSEIASVPTRIERSIDYQIEQARVYEAGDWSFDFVPVVQGLRPSDYRYCARRLKEAGVARQYMGIGTVCKRKQLDAVDRILEVCNEELPHTAFHLFGATRNVWKRPRFWGRFASGDTHAWARNTPEGNWPKDKADKRRAFHHYRGKMVDTIGEIADQPDPAHRGEQLSLFELLVKFGDGAKECHCGTKIPTYGVDFEPGCRNCQNTRLTRQTQHIEQLDNVPTPAEVRANDPVQTTLAATDD